MIPNIYVTKWVGALCILFFAMNNLAASESVSAEKQAKYLLKALASDKNLKTRSGSTVNILVLHKKGNESGAQEVLAAFQEAGKGGVLDLPVSVNVAPFKSVSALMKKISAEGVNAIYVDESLASALSSVQQVTRGKKVPSLCGSKSLVEKGVAIGVFSEGASAKLVVNLRAAKVEGLKLKAELLSISTIIK